MDKRPEDARDESPALQNPATNPWITAFVIIFAGIALAASTMKTTPTLTLLMADMGIGPGLAGWLGTATSIAGIALALPAGAIILKTGPKRLGIFCLSVTLLGNIIGSLASTFPLLLVSRFVEGVGFGLFGVVGPAIIISSFSSQKRGLPMALWSMFMGIGTLLVVTLSRSLTSSLSPETWTNVWYAAASLLAIALVLFVVLVKVPAAEGASAGRGNAGQTALGDARLAKAPRFAEGLKSPTSWLIGLVFMLFTAGYTSTMVFGPMYMQQELGLSADAANLNIMLMQLGSLVGGVLMGVVLNKAKNRMVVFGVAGVVTAVALSAVFSFSEGYAMAFLIVLGVITAMLPATIYATAGDAAPSPGLVGVTMGIMTLGNNVGGFGAAATGNVIAASGFSGATAFVMVLAVLLVISTALFVFLMKKKYAFAVKPQEARA